LKNLPRSGLANTVVVVSGPTWASATQRPTCAHRRDTDYALASNRMSQLIFIPHFFHTAITRGRSNIDGQSTCDFVQTKATGNDSVVDGWNRDFKIPQGRGPCATIVTLKRPIPHDDPTTNRRKSGEGVEKSLELRTLIQYISKYGPTDWVSSSPRATPERA
jgi:hypothetical protein